MSKTYWWQKSPPDEEKRDDNEDELRKIKEENEILKKQLEEERNNKSKNFVEKNLEEISIIHKDELFLKQGFQKALDIIKGIDNIPSE